MVPFQSTSNGDGAVFLRSPFAIPNSSADMMPDAMK